MNICKFKKNKIHCAVEEVQDVVFIIFKMQICD